MATITLNRDCQLEHDNPTPADWDAKLMAGPWAYVCDMHFKLCASPMYAASATKLERPKPPATTFGDFEVELDLEAGNLVVVNKSMGVRLLIGGDALDVTDLDGNYLKGVEL